VYSCTHSISSEPDISDGHMLWRQQVNSKGMQGSANRAATITSNINQSKPISSLIHGLVH